MRIFRVLLAITIAACLSAGSPAQSKREAGNKRTEKENTHNASGSTPGPRTERATPRVSPPTARAVRMTRPPGVSPPLAQDAPMTRPVDLNWPPEIFIPVYDPPVPYDPPSPTYVPTPDPPPERMRRPVQVVLSECVDNPDRAGYDFAEGRVVSCEDTTVDIYLSYSEKVGFSFIVPEDTDIKDVGERGSVMAVRRFKPSQWAENHAVPIMVGHVYVVWSYTEDFFLVRVKEVLEKSAIIEWVWHSRLSRKEAEEHEQKPEAQHSTKPETKTPDGPYFGK